MGHHAEDKRGLWTHQHPWLASAYGCQCFARPTAYKVPQNWGIRGLYVLTLLFSLSLYTLMSSRRIIFLSLYRKTRLSGCCNSGNGNRAWPEKLRLKQHPLPQKREPFQSVLRSAKFAATSTLLPTECWPALLKQTGQ